jgi:glucan phosphoethanolaminetransferase (alkaline phosphatase superfamily)
MQAVTEQKSSREPLVGGMVLVIIGVALLLAQLAPQLGQYIVLVVGLGLLAIFAFTRAYGALVGGAIVTGVGAGVAIAASTTGDVSGAAVVLSLGLGFVAIWAVSYLLRMAERHWWPLVPGTILGSIGGALLLGGAAQNLIAFWPVALIALGVLVIGRALMASRATG